MSAPAPVPPSLKRRLAERLAHAGFVVVMLFAVLSFTSKPPATLGLREGRLASCPDSPNCVSSLATEAGHAIAQIGRAHV